MKVGISGKEGSRRGFNALPEVKPEPEVEADQAMIHSIASCHFVCATKLGGEWAYEKYRCE